MDRDLEYGMLPDIAKTDVPLQTDGTGLKRILAAGENFYIKKSFAQYMKRWPDACRTDMLRIKNDLWKPSDFSGYHALLYAGESDTRKMDKPQESMAVRTAAKAKKDGVKMFLYTSSLCVYGQTAGRITEKTPVCPSDAYGKWKLRIEKELWQLNDKNFCIAILRLPPVYGYGCKGSYRNLADFTARFGFVPKYDRKSSRIHIDNLSSAVRGIIYHGRAGVYFPQDPESAGVYELAREIAEFHGKKLKSLKLPKPVMSLLADRIWGIQDRPCYICDQSLNVPGEWLEVKTIRESVRLAESGW